MHIYPRILFLAWMLAALIGIALSAPQLPTTPVAGHGVRGIGVAVGAGLSRMGDGVTGAPPGRGPAAKG